MPDQSTSIMSLQRPCISDGWTDILTSMFVYKFLQNVTVCLLDFVAASNKSSLSVLLCIGLTHLNAKSTSRTSWRQTIQVVIANPEVVAVWWLSKSGDVRTLPRSGWRRPNQTRPCFGEEYDHQLTASARDWGRIVLARQLTRMLWIKRHKTYIDITFRFLSDSSYTRKLSNWMFVLLLKPQSSKYCLIR